MVLHLSPSEGDRCSVSYVYRRCRMTEVTKKDVLNYDATKLIGLNVMVVRGAKRVFDGEDDSILIPDIAKLARTVAAIRLTKACIPLTYTEVKNINKILEVNLDMRIVEDDESFVKFYAVLGENNEWIITHCDIRMSIELERSLNLKNGVY